MKFLQKYFICQQLLEDSSGIFSSYFSILEFKLYN